LIFGSLMTLIIEQGFTQKTAIQADNDGSSPRQFRKVHCMPSLHTQQGCHGISMTHNCSLDLEHSLGWLNPACWVLLAGTWV